MNWKNVFVLVIFIDLCVLSGVAGYKLGARRGGPNTTSTQIDTLVVCDTIFKEKPIYKTRSVVDTILIPITETIVKHDTVFLPVNIEQKVYKDKDYEAYVSGYRPSLDSLNIFKQTEYITTTRKVYDDRKWGIGVQVGVGASVINSAVYLSPYIGVGVSYNFLRF